MSTDYTEQVNGYLKGTMAELLGIVVTSATPQRVVGEMIMRDDLRQPYGYMHGGAMMTLMDTVAGMASALNVAPGQNFLTAELKINFLRSVRSGRVTAETIPVHIGRRTHIWQVAAHDEQGRQLALVLMTQLVLEPREETVKDRI